MENFVVSARKYRPSTFNTVVGQSAITDTLKNAIRNNQLAQAFLFCGPRGVGKTTCARILAKTINCLNPTADIEPCNECDSCKSFNDAASMNIHELDAASNNSVDDIRVLVEQVRIPPQMGKYKVYIIDEVHMLSTQAFNAFLKTLEEPPAYAKFILATTEKHKILPTILSRCQIFDFKRIKVDDMAQHLRFVADSEGVTAEDEALHFIAHKADGGLRDALSIFDQMVNLGNKNITKDLVLENLNVLDYDYFFRILDFMSAGNYRDTLLLIHDIIEKGYEGQHIIMGLGEHLRNILMCFNPETVKLIETSEVVRGKYLQQAQKVPLQFTIEALNIINKADVSYRSSNYKRLTLEVAVLQVCKLSNSQMQYVKQPVQGVQPQQQAAAQPQSIQASQAAPVASAAPVNTPPQTLPQAPPVAQPMPEENVVNSPSAAEKPEAKVSTSRPATTISIKGITKGTAHAELKKEEPRQRNELFTLEQLEQAIRDYAETIKEDSALYHTALTAFKPELVNNRYIITVSNIVLEKEFNSRKNKLIEELSNVLQNDFINIAVKVTEEQTAEKKYLTDAEKLNMMIEENPNVKTLLDELNLDFDA